MKNKLGATVRSIDKRRVSVFPAMEYCDTCKRYTETRCIHTRPSPLRFKEVFEMWAQHIIARQELLKNQEAMFFMGSGTTHSECFPGLLNCITNDSILKDK